MRPHVRSEGRGVSGREVLRMRKFLLFVGAAFVLAGCGSDPCGPGDPGEPATFEVTVLTYRDMPVEGAWVEGGVDWTSYRVRTDSMGIARVPGSARGRPAFIHKNNFYPRFVEDLGADTYWLYPTPARLERVGDVEGRSLRFYTSVLTTLTYRGVYHAYAYDDTEVTELATKELAAWAIRDVKFVDERLWLSTHDEGVYAYSVIEPLSPDFQFHLDVEGYLGPIAVKGNVIVVGDPWGEDPVRVFSFTEDGQATLLSTIDAHYAAQMEFRGDNLIILSFNTYRSQEVTLKIVDLTDAEAPKTMYSLVEWGGRGGLLLEDYVLMGPNMSEGTFRIAYTTLFIGDPANPAYVGRTLSDTFLFTVPDGSYGFGAYCSRILGCTEYTCMYAVASGEVQSSFEAVAVLTECFYPEHGSVQAPPFFVVGDALWRLEQN
jgi:hypothetical protein